MNFLKKLIEETGVVAVEVVAEEVVTEGAKLELPTYSEKVGDFQINLAGAYNNAAGAIDEVFATVTTPDGRKFKAEAPLNKPVKDEYEAAETTFRPHEIAVWGLDGAPAEDNELGEMLAALVAQFLNDNFAEAVKEARANVDAAEFPKGFRPEID